MNAISSGLRHKTGAGPSKCQQGPAPSPRRSLAESRVQTRPCSTHKLTFMKLLPTVAAAGGVVALRGSPVRVCCSAQLGAALPMRLLELLELPAGLEAWALRGPPVVLAAE